MSTPARRPPPTRAELQRALAVNAATKPLNVAVGAGVAVAGIVIGAVWLIVIAVVIYAVLGLMTFFDEGEAERVGKRSYGGGDAAPKRTLDAGALARPIRTRVEAARQEERSIAVTIQDADLDWTDVRAEVRGLVDAMEATARRAQRLFGYLSTQDMQALQRRENAARGEQARDALRVQRQTLSQLHDRLDAAFSEMDAVLAALGTVHAKLVGASVAQEGAADEELAGTVRELRDRVDAVTDGLAAAYPTTP